MMAQFILMRHGTTDWQLARDRKLVGGCIDWVPLTAEGADEVRRSVRSLQGRGIALILSSPMTRALQSAAMTAGSLQADLRVEFDLHEWMPDMTFRYTKFEQVGLAVEDRRAMGGEWPPGEQRLWEPISQVRRRALAVLERYRAAEGLILVVCHCTVIESLTGKSLSCGEYIDYVLPEAP